MYVEDHELTDNLSPQYNGNGISSVVLQMSKAQGILKRGRANRLSTLLNLLDIAPEERVCFITHGVSVQAEYNRLLRI